MTMMTDKCMTVKARIADLNVLMHCKTQFMVNRLKAYVSDFDSAPDVEIDISKQQLAQYSEKYPHMNRDNAEYMLSGSVFYGKLYRYYNGFMLHASAIELDGEGYLFSANSGTGKSTHTQLWAKAFGERVQYINDDKPALRKTGSGWYVYGTPWSGKTALNNNISVPLKAIAFLHRSAENEIAPMLSKESIPAFLEQTIRPKTAQGFEKVLSLLGDLLENVPVYSLGCNMCEAAAHFAYEAMNK